jgi:cell division protein FtsQ
MKKRAILTKRSLREKRERTVFAVLGLIQRIGAGFLKVFLFVAVIAAVSLSLLSLYHYLLTSPYMKLEQVDIEGVDGKIRNELIEMCGLNSEQGLLGLNLNKLKKRMEEHTWIRSVKLERRFPHTLVVEVEKQVPLALVLTDRFYYVNQWGEIFKTVSGSDDNDFPIITGLSKNGSRAKEQLGKTMHVITVLESEDDLWSLDKVSEIHIRKNGEISLYFNHLRAEVTFMWNELGDKIDGLKKVAEHLNQSGKTDTVTHIDLNYEDGAVVSFSNS